jgi:hypothetical protein
MEPQTIEQQSIIKAVADLKLGVAVRATTIPYLLS